MEEGANPTPVRPTRGRMAHLLSSCEMRPVCTEQNIISVRRRNEMCSMFARNQTLRNLPPETTTNQSQFACKTKTSTAPTNDQSLNTHGSFNMHLHHRCYNISPAHCIFRHACLHALYISTHLSTLIIQCLLQLSLHSASFWFTIYRNTCPDMVCLIYMYIYALIYFYTYLHILYITAKYLCSTVFVQLCSPGF